MVIYILGLVLKNLNEIQNLVAYANRLWNLGQICEKREIVFMSKDRKKMTFEVQENETIEECLERIKNQGYSPTRRTEKPIFQEVIKGSETAYDPVGRQIIFEARVIDKSEH